MFSSRRIGVAGVVGSAVVMGFAVLSAAPAHADEASYLELLQPRLTFLSADQLRTEGYRVCAATSSGMPASDANDMVQADLGVSVPVSIDIVTAAVVNLC